MSIDPREIDSTDITMLLDLGVLGEVEVLVDITIDPRGRHSIDGAHIWVAMGSHNIDLTPLLTDAVKDRIMEQMEEEY